MARISKKCITLLLLCSMIIAGLGSVPHATGVLDCSQATRGFVQVNASNLCLNGKRVWLVGGNSYGILSGYLGAGYVTNDVPNSTLRIDQAGNAQLGALRVWLDVAGNNNYWFGQVYQVYTQDPSHSAYFSAVDRLVADAKRNNVLLVLTIGTGANSWSSLANGTDYYSVGSPANQKYKTEWVAPIVSHYKMETQIAWWELANEANCCSLNTTQFDERVNWAKNLTSFVKGLDPNHLVEGGWTGGISAGSNSLDFTKFDALNSFLDIASVHSYNSSTVNTMVQLGAPDQQTAVYDYVQQLTYHSKNVLGKPLLFGEFGANLVNDPTGRFDNWLLGASYKYDGDAALIWSWEEGYCNGGDLLFVSPSCTPQVVQLLTGWSTLNQTSIVNPPPTPGTGVPILSRLASKNVETGQGLTILVNATDPDGESVTLSSSNMPTGSVFDPSTGIFTWTPRAGQEGNYAVTFTAIDSGSPSQSSSENVEISVLKGSGGSCSLNCIIPVLGQPIVFPIIITFLGVLNGVLGFGLVSARLRLRRLREQVHGRGRSGSMS